MGIDVCVSSSTKSLVDNHLSEYIMEALLGVLKIAASHNVCVYAREIKGLYGCVYVCHLHSPVDNCLCLGVCMNMFVNSAEQL